MKNLFIPLLIVMLLIILFLIQRPFNNLLGQKAYIKNNKLIIEIDLDNENKVQLKKDTN